MYNNYISTALERLFLDKSRHGFWNEEEGKIEERIYHGKNWNWEYVEHKGYRYGLFCLSTILLAVEYNNLDLGIYFNKIQKYLDWIRLNVQNLSLSEVTYGALLSWILGIKLKLINEESHSTIEELLIKSMNESISSYDNQNYLVLIPAYYYINLFDSQRVKEKIILLTEKILNSADKNGLFQTGDLRYCYHQRLMYTIWGLIHSSYFCYEDEINKKVKKLLYYVWENRRQNDIDNAFLWHPKFYFVKNRIGSIPIPILNIKSSKYLFECHQTFFVNAVNFFNKRYRENILVTESTSALEWILGKNRLQADLCKISKIGIPVRIMTLDKKLFVENENYKGSYEIGSYILALSSYNKII